MSQIMKAYLGIILILCITFSSLSIFQAFLMVIDAQDMQQNIVNELENSDFYRPVMEESFEMAARRDYNLVLTLYQSDYTSIECRAIEDVPMSTDEVLYAGVALEFPITIPFWNVSQQKKLFAYAR